MSNDSYNSFCPIAKACELIEPRWTLLILSEILAGATRFNEIRRGVPGISPTLLSKRLKEMEARGLLARRQHQITGDNHYAPTPIAMELHPIMAALGAWAHRNVDVEVTLEHLDAGLLMWNVRRKIDVSSLPAARRTVIQFIFTDLPRDEKDYWLIAKPGLPVDLCFNDPGQDVDLYVSAPLKVLTAAWMGYSNILSEIALGRINLIGDRGLQSSLSNWMVRSSFAAA